MDEFLQQGIQAYQSGDRETARKALINAVKQSPDSEQAWGWMFSVCRSDQERIHCLKQVLRINPNNEKAQQMITKYDGSDFPFESQPLSHTNGNDQTISSHKDQFNDPIQAMALTNIGGYVRSILLPNERVLAIGKIHWTLYLNSIFFGLLALLGTIFSLIPTVSGSGQGGSNSSIFLAIFAICGLPFWIFMVIASIRAFLIRKYTEFALTDKRIIGKVGMISRSSIELVLEKIETITVSQTLMGRLFNYGTLVIIGSGGTRHPIRYIADPMKMKQSINEILAKIMNRRQ